MSGFNYRNGHHPEDWVRQYQKWIVQCQGCQIMGYRHDLPEHYSFNVVRKVFKPLTLNGNGLCEMCETSL